MFSVICVFLFVSGLNGQVIVQAGMNVSSWRVTSALGSYESNSKIGFHAGINYATPVSETFKFKSGLIYSQKGAKEFIDPPTSLNYLEVPLNFVYQKNPEEGFYANGGLYIAYLLSAEFFGNDIKDNFKNTDLGLNLGAGYDFSKLIVGFQGGLGLINIFRNDGTANEITPTNSNGQIFLAVKF